MDEMIETMLGPLERRVLERRDTVIETERERTTRVEYWFMGQLVRSDVHITLLKGSIVAGAVGRLG